MKTLIFTFILTAIFSLNRLNAQPQYIEDYHDYPVYDLSDNFDLEAMAYVFANSSSIKSFERKLNSNHYNISNLDLNNDGYIDYIRVMELPQHGFSVIFVQAVLGRNIIQDIATIEVKKLRKNRVAIQVIGDEYLFGYNYIVEPILWKRPAIASYFHQDHRKVWVSPYAWNYYPVYFEFRMPIRVAVYRWNVMDRYTSKMVFAYPQNHYVTFNYHNVKHYHRHDYAYHNPNKSFKHRNEGFRNYKERKNKYYDDKHRYLNNNNYRSDNQSDRIRKTNPSYTAPSKNRDLKRELNRRIEKSNITYKQQEKNKSQSKIENNRRQINSNNNNRSKEVDSRRSREFSTKASNNRNAERKASVDHRKPVDNKKSRTVPSRSIKIKKEETSRSRR